MAKTYVTVGHSNVAEIVYAGEDKEKAMNSELYPNADSLNVHVWEDGKEVQTFFKTILVDEESEWEDVTLA